MLIMKPRFLPYKKNILALSFLLLVCTCSAQYTQVVRGTVTDKETRQALVGARIILIGSSPVLSAVADIDGKYKMNEVPIGRHDFKVSYLGYQDMIVPDMEVNSGKECIINAELVEAINQTEEIVVKAEKSKDKPLNEMAVVSARTFSIDETQRYAGALGDPARMAGNFAGVSGSNDSRNDIIIRGNSPAGLLWRLEGIDIPNPNHFAAQGTTGGPVSILNNNVLSNSDFFTGAWPAEYGNANSGVFDLKMRNGNNERFEFTGQVGFNGFEAMTEGPFDKTTGASFLASYRYSALGIFQDLGINLGPAGVPIYQDLSFKINIPNKKLGDFQVFGIGGISSIQILDSKKKADNFSYGQNHRDIYFGSDMGAFGVIHIWPIGTTGYIKNIISVSAEKHSTHVDSVATPTDLYDLYDENATYYRIKLHSMLNQKIDARNTLKVGIILTRLNFNMDQRYYSSFYKLWLDLTNATGTTWLGQGYAELKHNFTEKFSLLGGLQYEYLFLNNTWSIEPRGGVKYQLDRASSLSFGYGLHGQMQQMETYFTETRIGFGNDYILTNKGLGFTKSQHFVLGYDRTLGKDFSIKLETYYQNLFNVPVQAARGTYSALNFGDSYGVVLPDHLINNGTGKNYGLEMTLEKFFGNGYYFLVTASLYDSKYIGSDGVERNTAFNSTFTANILGGYEFKIGKTGNNLININGKCTYAGGRYYTPIDLTNSERVGQFIPDYAKAYTLRYPNYFKLDLRAGYKINSRKLTQEFALDVQNVTNQKNILSQSYDPTTKSAKDEYQLGVFPMILYRVQF
jgi:hypothetical protein